jgi:hypothetical protein
MKYLLNRVLFGLAVFALIPGLVVPSGTLAKAGITVNNSETGDGGYRGYEILETIRPDNNTAAAEGFYITCGTDVPESKAQNLDETAASGTAWAWGRNTYGQLGDGTTTTSNIPVQVLNLTGVTAVDGGEYHSLALKSDGTVWAWGENGYGQLGTGNLHDESTPVKVINLSNVTVIAGGKSHSLAVKSDGTAWAWGYNAYGQLGNGTISGGTSTPGQVSNLSGVKAVGGGEDHGLALTSDNTVWAWGKNWFGQLGDGTTENRNTPVQVTSLSGVTAIAAGGAHSLALKSNGTVWAWGNGTYGQLGNGSDTGSTTPVQVSNLSSIKAVACGKNHNLAIKSDGTIWVWGYNKYGQLGDGTTDTQYTPIQISGLGSVRAIAGGEYHSLAANTVGAAFSWGHNIFGQLGDGTTDEKHTPVQVNGLPSVFTAGGGYNHSLAIQEVKKPDLIITDVWHEDGSIYYQIRNIGEATAPAGHDTLLSIDDNEVAKNVIATELAPGQRLKDSFAATWQCSQPQHSVEVCADADDDVAEIDETNNCREETWKCDNTPPVITAGPVVSGITQTSATISWSTDEDSSSVVEYGRVAGKYLWAQDETPVTDHEITLDTLTAATVYHYVVKSADSCGNTAVSDEGFFETEPPADAVSPEVHELTVSRSDTHFLCYDLEADASDDIGVARVEFFLDDVLIGTDYSEPYGYKLDPLALGFSRESFFTGDREVSAIAYDFSGGQTQRTTIPSWASEPVPIQLEVWPNHHFDRYVDGLWGTTPSDATIEIRAHAYEYELIARWAGKKLLGFDEVKQAVDYVVFDPSNGGRIVRHDPDYGYEYDYSYTWDISSLHVGTYSIDIEAHANDGSVKTTTRFLHVEEGEPRLYVERDVSRIDNFFEVALTVDNLGDATTEIDRIEDNLANFQPLTKTDAYAGNSVSYNVTAASSCNASGVYTIVEIELFTNSGSVVVLEPGEGFSVRYLAVPVLNAASADFGIGSSDVQVYHWDGSMESFDRPCSLTFDGSTLSSAVADAKAGSDFLVVTNAERMFTLFPQAETCDVLTAMAELALLKSGILGYVTDRDKNAVHDTIKDWGVGMTGSDGVEGNYLKSGYLLLVGESELIGSWTVYIGGYDDVLYSDLPYANTEGEFRNPELIVGRIIGNDAGALIAPIQASINVYNGEPDFEWDRTKALVISGKGEGASVFEDDADEVAELLDDEFPIVTTLKQRDIEDVGGNVTVEIKVNDADQDVVVYRDHGWPTCWTDVIYRRYFGGADPVDFESSKPFVFAICCWAGRYEDEDIDDDGILEGENGIAEKFLEHGTAVYIGSTQVSKRYKNGAAAEDFFDRWVGSSDSVAKAFRDFKRDFNGTRGKRYWISEYNLYGDPKYGSSTTVASSAAAAETASSEPPTSLDIVIPDYEVTITGENEDSVSIPGGGMIIEEDRPMVPYYTVKLDYPRGQRVQDVIMTDRSGMTSATGMNIPVASGEIDMVTVSAPFPGDDEAWWPGDAFGWEVCENADGSSTLMIEIYPFYYNRLTTDVRFYKNYSFNIQVATSTVEIVSLDTDSNAYTQGDAVPVDLWIENTGDSQNVIISVVVTADGSGEAVDGLLLTTMKELTGTASFSPAWNSGGFEPGYYYIDVTLRNTAGYILDRKMEMFRLGIQFGEITSLTATPQNFEVGDSVDISLDFTNTGTVSISGAAIVKVQNETGDIIEKFRSDFTDLATGNSTTFDYVWDTSEATDNSYKIVGYVLYDSEANDPVSIIITANQVTSICGDVNDDGNVNMADVMILWYDIADYPSAGAWTISNEWAADVNCDGEINMADVMILWYDIADYPSAGAWEANCCE